MKEPAEKTTGKGKGRKGQSFLVFLLLASLVAMGANFYYVAVHDRFDKEYISLASEESALSQRIAKRVFSAMTAQNPADTIEALSLLKEGRDRFQRTMSLLEQGNPATALPPSPEETAPQLSAVQTRWSEMRRSADLILSHSSDLLNLRELAAQFAKALPQVAARSAALVDIIVEKKGSPELVSNASHQSVLVERIADNVNRLLGGTGNASAVAAQLTRDSALFGKVLQGMDSGNDQLNIPALKDSGARDKLDEVKKSFQAANEPLTKILGKSDMLAQVHGAATQIFDASETMLDDTAALVGAYSKLSENRPISSITGYALGGVALILLLWLSANVVREARRHQAESERQQHLAAEQNRRNQDAILRLLDEITDLADGNLTVHATVTEDFTGAIADSINYTIDALRELVAAINQTTQQVSLAAQETQATAMHLAEASDHQAQEISSASGAINDMAQAMEQAAGEADEATVVAQNSVRTAQRGADAVRRTIQGMNAIREQIQETSKRIKRLGESSQEIGEILGLINDIADQTNILALNAAIQAAMAGEAGRGFAVVADEVQRLAERAGNATKQIDALVKTIQTDTNEAVTSMEESTSDVVRGAKLAEDAGQSLDEIDSVSNQLAALIQRVSQAAQTQVRSAINISETMNVIQEITTQTSAGTNETATSIGNLAELANELRKSVAGFKLPG